GINGSTWLLPFLERSFGMTHCGVGAAELISDRDMPPTSARRQPVRISNRMTRPWSSSLQAFQIRTSSESVSTRDRGSPVLGSGAPITGLVSASPICMAHEKNAESDARAKLATPAL